MVLQPKELHAFVKTEKLVCNATPGARTTAVRVDSGIVAVVEQLQSDAYASEQGRSYQPNVAITFKRAQTGSPPPSEFGSPEAHFS